MICVLTSTYICTLCMCKCIRVDLCIILKYEKQIKKIFDKLHDNFFRQNVDLLHIIGESWSFYIIFNFNSD